MKKILMSLFTIAIVGALITGGTVAVFSDVEEVGQQSFTAGTLDLTVGGSVTVPITLGNMKPGDGMGGAEHGTISYTFTVHNAGTIDGKLKIHIINVTNYENGRNGPEILVDGTGGNPGPGNGELGQYLNMQVNWPGGPGFHYSHHCSDPNCGASPPPGKSHTINCWECVVMEIPTYVLAAGATDTGVLEFMLPSTVGNIIQSDSVAFSIEFTLVQA